jgi:hypothetical protein
VAISTRYWVEIECDTCGKKESFESTAMGADRIPDDWIQTPPPGEKVIREFCSIECLSNYKPPPKPWEE